MASSLSSPAINVHYYEWKCLRFWYLIGTTDAVDRHTTSLMLLLRTVTSNRTVVLFFADEVTDKARYTQLPLSRNSTNSQVSFKTCFTCRTPSINMIVYFSRTAEVRDFRNMYVMSSTLVPALL